MYTFLGLSVYISYILASSFLEHANKAYYYSAPAHILHTQSTQANSREIRL